MVYLNLGLKNSYIQSCSKYQLILWLSLLYCALYISSEMVGLVKNGFNSMLNLGLSFVNGVRTIRSTQIFFLGKFSKTTIYFIWPCTLTSICYWLPYRTASFFFTMTHSRLIQLFLMHHLFLIHYRKGKNIHVSRN